MLGLWGLFICLAFAVFCFSNGRKIAFVELVALICLFRVGLAQIFVGVDWASEVA
jgi:hypothetical protein